jgi:hypothetical protein
MERTEERNKDHVIRSKNRRKREKGKEPPVPIE